MEKVYKTMRNVGAMSIVIGTIVLATGVTLGVVSIVNGALLLRRKKEIIF